MGFGDDGKMKRKRPSDWPEIHYLGEKKPRRSNLDLIGILVLVFVVVTLAMIAVP